MIGSTAPLLLTAPRCTPRVADRQPSLNFAEVEPAPSACSMPRSSSQLAYVQKGSLFRRSSRHGMGKPT
eukprot:7833829-Heterocapsa_arctica.AAC.1